MTEHEQAYTKQQQQQQQQQLGLGGLVTAITLHLGSLRSQTLEPERHV